MHHNNYHTWFGQELEDLCVFFCVLRSYCPLALLFHLWHHIVYGKNDMIRLACISSWIYPFLYGVIPTLHITLRLKLIKHWSNTFISVALMFNQCCFKSLCCPGLCTTDKMCLPTSRGINSYRSLGIDCGVLRMHRLQPGWSVGRMFSAKIYITSHIHIYCC